MGTESDEGRFEIGDRVAVGNRFKGVVTALEGDDHYCVYWRKPGGEEYNDLFCAKQMRKLPPFQVGQLLVIERSNSEAIRVRPLAERTVVAIKILVDWVRYKHPDGREDWAHTEAFDPVDPEFDAPRKVSAWKWEWEV